MFHHLKVIITDGNLANRELAASRLAVLDIGANTLDLCRVDSLEFIDRESTSYSDLGVFECYRQLSLEIYNAFGIEIPPEEIEPHIVNYAVKIGGRSQGIADIKNRFYSRVKKPTGSSRESRTLSARTALSAVVRSLLPTACATAMPRDA